MCKKNRILICTALMIFLPLFSQAQEKDLQDLQTPVKNQGPRDTCSYFAVNGLLESVIKKFTGLEYDLSEEYEIYQHKVVNPWRPEVEFGNTWQLIETFTSRLYFYTENEIPYRAESVSWRAPLALPPSPSHHFRSLKAKILTKMWTSKSWSQLIMDELNQDRPVVITLKVSQKHIEDSSGFLFYDAAINSACDQGALPCGGHAVLLVGYDQSKKIFKFKNSWGPAWGRQGYGFVTFDHVDQYSDQPLTATFDKLLDPWIK